MAAVALEADRILTLMPQLLMTPAKRIWLAYDEEADVLYVNFKKPSHADDSELTNDDIIIRYEGEQVVGMTILNVSHRQPAFVAARQPEMMGATHPGTRP
jgi:uncharacterized protein YuzE